MSRLRHLFLLLVVAPLAALGLNVATPDAGHAAGYTRCVGGTYSGTCSEYLSSVGRSVYVEAVPLVNRSPYTGTFRCGFSTTVSRSLTASVSLTYEEKVSLLTVVDVSVSANVSMSITQTASQATSAGGSFTLRPGQRVTCYRTYGYVNAIVRERQYAGCRVVSVRDVTTAVPSYLGVTVTA